MLADVAAQAAHIFCQLGVCPTEVRLRQEQVGALLASPPARACSAPRTKCCEGLESTQVTQVVQEVGHGRTIPPAPPQGPQGTVRVPI